MLAKTQLARIRQVQTAFSILAVLDTTSNLYPKDAHVCSGDEHDYVVVGGGTAGVVVASRLVEANFSVLVIEAGDIPGPDSVFPGLVPYIKNSRIDWNHTAETNCKTDRCLTAVGGSFYGRGIGGTGALNYLIYGRGNARDFNKIYEVTKDPSWKWKNMLKYFIKSQKLQSGEIANSSHAKFYGTEGKIGVSKEDRPIIEDFLKGYEEAGERVVIDNVGSGVGLGYSKCLYHISNGKRSHAGNAYLTPHKDNPKLYVTRSSLAKKIIFDKNKNAVGIEFDKKGKTITVVARKEVIITAGPINSPQLLMLSGIGPKEDLKDKNINVISDLPVGKNLQCIMGAFLDFKTNRKAKPPAFDANKLPAPIILGYSALDKCNRYPDYELQSFIIDDSAYFLSLCAFTLKLKNSICDRLLAAADKKQMVVSILLNINPKSRGSVSLQSADPNDKPKIVYGYYTDEADLNATIDYIQHYMKVKGSRAFQKLGLEFLEPTANCGNYDFGSKKYWRCYALCLVALTGRTAGTCAMGSVVDSQLRVRGVNRLRVVGASVLPNALGGSIFAPEVALSEKIVEMIIANEQTECKK